MPEYCFVYLVCLYHTWIRLVDSQQIDPCVDAISKDSQTLSIVTVQFSDIFTYANEVHCRREGDVASQDDYRDVV
jgi:hypothetical protein